MSQPLNQIAQNLKIKLASSIQKSPQIDIQRPPRQNNEQHFGYRITQNFILTFENEIRTFADPAEFYDPTCVSLTRNWLLKELRLGQLDYKCCVDSGEGENDEEKDQPGDLHDYSEWMDDEKEDQVPEPQRDSDGLHDHSEGEENEVLVLVSECDPEHDDKEEEYDEKEDQVPESEHDDKEEGYDEKEDQEESEYGHGDVRGGSEDEKEDEVPEYPEDLYDEKEDEVLQYPEGLPGWDDEKEDEVPEYHEDVYDEKEDTDDKDDLVLPDNSEWDNDDKEDQIPLSPKLFHDENEDKTDENEDKTDETEDKTDEGEDKTDENEDKTDEKEDHTAEHEDEGYTSANELSLDGADSNESDSYDSVVVIISVCSDDPASFQARPTQEQMDALTMLLGHSPQWWVSYRNI
ncbi:hypothetical protein DFH29DRAFT_996507 [Suillus ampliporus]|nr:hypothetical protein DFH29DRAFT_996507 [Suillus ampliporus]